MEVVSESWRTLECWQTYSFTCIFMYTNETFCSENGSKNKQLSLLRIYCRNIETILVHCICFFLLNNDLACLLLLHSDYCPDLSCLIQTTKYTIYQPLVRTTSALSMQRSKQNFHFFGRIQSFEASLECVLLINIGDLPQQ